MDLTFAPNGILQIDNAHIAFKNFEGRETQYNRKGDRNFSLIIPDQEVCDALMEDKNEYGKGWNVKIKPPREEGDEPFMHMKVKVKFNGRGPIVYLVSGKNRVQLNEDTIGRLDDIRIDHVNLDIRPYDDVLPSGAFRAAYLQSMEVHQDLSFDRFAARYDEE